MGGSERITFSVPEEDEYLLEEVDALIEKGVYENRTEAIRESIRIQEKNFYKRRFNLYDAAVRSLYEAEKKGMYQVAENARSHIIETFPDTDMANLLEE